MKLSIKSLTAVAALALGTITVGCSSPDQEQSHEVTSQAGVDSQKDLIGARQLQELYCEYPSGKVLHRIFEGNSAYVSRDGFSNNRRYEDTTLEASSGLPCHMTDFNAIPNDISTREFTEIRRKELGIKDSFVDPTLYEQYTSDPNAVSAPPPLNAKPL